MAIPQPRVTGSPQPSRERVLEGLFLGSPLPMLLVDVRVRRIARANSRLAELTGWAQEELTGLPLCELDPAEGGDVEEYLLLAIACRDDRPHRRMWRTRDGEPLPVEIQATRLHGDQGTLVALYVRDVRSEHETEKDLGRLQSQLWMAQKHEAVGRLASGIAHDFNNLLSAVMLTAESLRDTVDAEVHRELGLIVDAGLKARDLTRELLAFSGRQALDAHPIRLDDVVAGMETLLRRTLPQDIDLLIRPCRGNTVVQADPGQMQQVLLNLVVNARDAMPDGGYLVVATGEVDIDEAFAREFATVRAGPHVLLSVTDTGEGMDEDTQERIFEPFFSTRKRGEGRGLGLATVYGIVKQSGGSIWVTSQPGFGTTFRVYLPRLLVEPEALGADLDVEDESMPRGTEHVLLVEDDETVRLQIAKVLRALGYRVTEAGTPDDAVRIHDGLWPERGPHPIDLLLADVVMPGMDGPELARRLRVKREDLPVLYVSGYLDPADDRREEITGATTHLAKPFTRSELGRRVRSFLDRVHESGHNTPEPSPR